MTLLNIKRGKAEHHPYFNFKQILLLKLAKKQLQFSNQTTNRLKNFQ